MRGSDKRPGELFSYVDLEQRVRSDHPLRAIRALTDTALAALSGDFAVPMDGEIDAWFDRELAGCNLADERLNKRLRKLVAQIGSAMGQSIPLVCQDWANTKAAYLFSPTTGSARLIFWPVTFSRPVIARPPPMALFLCSTTRPSSPIKGRTRTRSGSPRASTAAGTKPGA